MDDRGPWIETYTGIKFYPLDPKPEDINIYDIAHSLSMLTRFNGHCEEFYSVAQHSVLVAELVYKMTGSLVDARWGLLHDATEAYIGDMTRPLKSVMPQFKEIENKIMNCICDVFFLPHEQPLVVKQADNILLATERRDLLPVSNNIWSPLPMPLDTIIYPVSSESARRMFMDAFNNFSAWSGP